MIRVKILNCIFVVIYFTDDRGIDQSDFTIDQVDLPAFNLLPIERLLHRPSQFICFDLSTHIFLSPSMVLSGGHVATAGAAHEIQTRRVHLIFRSNAEEKVET